MKEKFDDGAPAVQRQTERQLYEYEDGEEVGAEATPYKPEEKKSGKSKTVRRAGKTVKIKDGQPTNLPAHFYNEDGEVDLSKVTGAEAYRYFAMNGIKLPIIQR